MGMLFKSSTLTASFTPLKLKNEPKTLNSLSFVLCVCPFRVYNGYQ